MRIQFLFELLQNMPIDMTYEVAGSELDRLNKIQRDEMRPFTQEEKAEFTKYFCYYHFLQNNDLKSIVADDIEING